MAVAKKVLVVLLIISFFLSIFVIAVGGVGKDVLVLGADTSEKRPGIGGIDMAYVLSFGGLTFVEKNALYPGGMTHPTAKPPAGVGTSKLYLHDSFWSEDLNNDADLAREIVKANTEYDPGLVIVFTPKAIDTMLFAIGSNTNNSIEAMRADQNDKGMSRGDAVDKTADELMGAVFSPKVVLLGMATLKSYLAGDIYIFL